MKYQIISLLLILFSFKTNAQRIDVDFFNNLQYKSTKDNYNATLRQDIFDDVIFTDKYDNKATFTKKYLNLKYPKVLNNDAIKKQFFKHLILDYRKKKNYKISYSIDVFNKEIIKDNRDNKVEIGEDIFGHNTYERVINGLKTSIKTSVSGVLEYQHGNQKATLNKNYHNQWIYSDISGNKLEFGSSTWDRFKKTYGSNEDIFAFLIHNFL